MWNSWEHLKVLRVSASECVSCKGITESFLVLTAERCRHVHRACIKSTFSNRALFILLSLWKLDRSTLKCLKRDACWTS